MLKDLASILSTPITFGALSNILQISGVFYFIRDTIHFIEELKEKRIDSFSSVEKKGMILIEEIVEAGFNPDLVVGIGRSGAFLGGWLAGNLGSLPIQVLDRTFGDTEERNILYPNAAAMLETIRNIQGSNLNVLIVEGGSTTGATLENFSALQKQYCPNWNCRYSVLYEVKAATFKSDFVAKRIRKAPRRYPWHKTINYRKYLNLPKQKRASAN